MDKEVVGAVKAVVADPADVNVVYVGAVNGGVWRTRNARAAAPTWEQLTDAQASLSIGALDLDPTDTTRQTVVAGTGRFSSLRRMGGALIGVLRSTNGGTTWATLGTAVFRRFHICGIAARGNIIVVATNNGGVFRTVNTGSAWNALSGAAGTGLPAGFSFALAGDPTTPTRLYAHVGTAGIFRSDDSGATWRKVSNAAIDALLRPDTVNVKLAIGVRNNVYVAIANGGQRAQLAGLFRSGDGGATWSALDLPRTIEVGGVVFGIHPGRQAGIHLSLVADRENENVAYVGGDRQVGSDEAVPGHPRFPNSIGARDYSGRLFRVDASRPSGSQASPLTHVNTASNSAPHADSRDMAVDDGGDLIEVDDGGVYRRTRPLANSGDWQSMNGNLQTAEIHSIAWDEGVHTAIGGLQDAGSPQQLVRSAARWPSVSTGDGGAVEVGHQGGSSTRYSGYQELRDFRREVYDATGAFQSRTRIALFVLPGGNPIRPQFYTPIELNRVNPDRLIVGGANSVYESDDEGNTVTEIGRGIKVNEAILTTAAAPIAYGVVGNADLLFVGSGLDVFVRTAAHPAPLVPSAAYPATGEVISIAIQNASIAYVIDAAHVYRTPDAGVSWTEITNGLLALGGLSFTRSPFARTSTAGASSSAPTRASSAPPVPALHGRSSVQDCRMSLFCDSSIPLATASS